MTYLVNNEEDFAKEAVEGFAAAYETYVQPVHGGVVRANTSPDKEVSIVIGRGLCHYPAFTRWVGPGMAHGSVCGNILSSPSTSQAKSVCKAVSNGGGTLILFGNYAGDVLHFGNTTQQIQAEGDDVRIFATTDDIASGKPENHLERRGIANDLFIVKITDAAATGKTLDEFEEITIHGNIPSIVLSWRAAKLSNPLLTSKNATQSDKTKICPFCIKMSVLVVI